MSKVAVDKENVYFYVQTANPITSSTDPNWMLLLIDADNNYSTGWYGYDYLIKRKGYRPTKEDMGFISELKKYVDICKKE